MNSPSKPWLAVLIVGLGGAFTAPASAIPFVFSATGSDAASIQATVDGFRATLGAPNNGATPGSQPTGRRELNWDGDTTSVSFASPALMFADRGALLTTPGSGFLISGSEFSELNPSYPAIFTTFSSPRLLAPLGSNLLDVLFSVPGTTDSAVTRGFGAVFTDVDLAATTSLSFFDLSNNLLGTYAASAFNNGLSFLGVYFTDPLPMISRVRITLGNSTIGVNDGGNVDVVALDDFIFGEPSGRTPQPVPEPGTLLLLGAGLAAGLFMRRRVPR